VYTLTEPLTIATRYAYDLGEVGLLAAMTAPTVLSWALRPPSRRMRSPQRES